MTHRPAWPWDHEVVRIATTEDAHATLDQRHGPRVEEFLQVMLGEAERMALGFIDLSANPLASMAEQLSSPGLFGEPPELHHVDPAADALIGKEGLLSDAGWQSTMQAAEYYARGLGCVAIVPNWEEGVGPHTCPLTFTLVQPYDLHVETRYRRPFDVARLYERRLHVLDGEEVWTWHVWDLSDRSAPTYRVYDDVGEDAQDLTARLFRAEDGGLYDGEGYPWRYSDGAPFIPHTFLRRSARSFWAWEQNRVLSEATLHAVRLMNSALYTADAGSIGYTMIDGEVEGTEARNSYEGRPVSALSVMPGSLVKVRGREDRPLTVRQIQPATDPEAMLRVTENYILSVLSVVGLGGAKAQRTEGNPTSAAALAILDEDKRAAQRQLAPIAEPAVRELLCKTAALARVHGGVELPESGYRVTFKMLPLSPQQQAEERDQSNFEREQGLISSVDLYLREHPGATRAQAKAAILRARLDELELDTLERLGGGAQEIEARILEALDAIKEGDLDGVLEALTDARSVLGLPEPVPDEDEGGVGA